MSILTLVPINGEPRIQDLQLAERLGFERPRKIRELIQRNLEKLNQISICPTVGQIHEGAGRPTAAYYLNEKQSIFICMKADTVNAFEVQMEIIDVYAAYRRGDLGAADREVARLRQALLETNPVWGKIYRGRLAGFNNEEIARALECGETSVRRHITKMRAYGLMPSLERDAKGVHSAQLDLFGEARP